MCYSIYVEVRRQPCTCLRKGLCVICLWCVTGCLTHELRVFSGLTSSSSQEHCTWLFFMWVLGIWTQVLSFVHSKWLILHFPACLPLLPWDEVLLCSPRAFLCLPHRSFTENEVSLFLSCCAALGRSAICHQTTLEMWACLSWSWPQRTS